MTVGEGLSAATHRIGSIFAWAVIAATVGLVLHMIEDRAGFLGQVAAGIVGGRLEPCNDVCRSRACL